MKRQTLIFKVEKRNSKKINRILKGLSNEYADNFIEHLFLKPKKLTLSSERCLVVLNPNFLKKEKIKIFNEERNTKIKNLMAYFLISDFKVKKLDEYIIRIYEENGKKFFELDIEFLNLINSIACRIYNDTIVSPYIIRGINFVYPFSSEFYGFEKYLVNKENVKLLNENIKLNFFPTCLDKEERKVLLKKRIPLNQIASNIPFTEDEIKELVNGTDDLMQIFTFMYRNSIKFDVVKERLEELINFNIKPTKNKKVSDTIKNGRKLLLRDMKYNIERKIKMTEEIFNIKVKKIYYNENYVILFNDNRIVMYIPSSRSIFFMLYIGNKSARVFVKA